MDVQKYIDKMVLVPIERWNQLLGIEQRTLEKTEEQRDLENKVEGIEHKTNDSGDENENMNEYPPPPPPGIPLNEQEIVYESQPIKKKRIKERKKEEKTSKSLNHRKRKQTLISDWLSLP